MICISPLLNYIYSPASLFIITARESSYEIPLLIQSHTIARMISVEAPSLQYYDSSRISEEMQKEHQKAWNPALFVCYPGTRSIKYEMTYSQTEHDQVETQIITAPENTPPNSSSRDPRRSSSSKRVSDEAEKAAEQSLVSCQRCGVNFKTDEANYIPLKSTEDFLFRDSHCGKCQEDIKAAGTSSPSNKQNNADHETSNKRHLKEEADYQTSSPCCCIIM